VVVVNSLRRKLQKNNRREVKYLRCQPAWRTPIYFANLSLLSNRCRKKCWDSNCLTKTRRARLRLWYPPSDFCALGVCKQQVKTAKCVECVCGSARSSASSYDILLNDAYVTKTAATEFCKLNNASEDYSKIW